MVAAVTDPVTSASSFGRLLWPLDGSPSQAVIVDDTWRTAVSATLWALKYEKPFGADRNVAVEVLRRAAERNPMPEYQWWLAEALHTAGEVEAAETLEAEIVRRGELADPRTLALFLATRGKEGAIAVRLAREELKQRGDVFTHDALASVAFRRGIS